MTTVEKLLELQEAREQAERERDALWHGLCQEISTLDARDRAAYLKAMDMIRDYGRATRRAEREHARISALLRIDPGLTDHSED